MDIKQAGSAAGARVLMENSREKWEMECLEFSEQIKESVIKFTEFVLETERKKDVMRAELETEQQQWI